MNLKDAFDGIRETTQSKRPVRAASAAPAPLPARVSRETMRGLSPAAGPAKSREPGSAKSSHPDFEQVTVYVRKQTRKAAWRRWEDEEGGDFSDLVEQLLAGYLKG